MLKRCRALSRAIFVYFDTRIGSLVFLKASLYSITVCDICLASSSSLLSNIVMIWLKGVRYSWLTKVSVMDFCLLYSFSAEM